MEHLIVFLWALAGPGCLTAVLIVVVIQEFRRVTRGTSDEEEVDLNTRITYDV